MGSVRARMLQVLEHHGVGPERAAGMYVEDLLDIRQFGVASAYECVEWLEEHGLRNHDLDQWVESRAAAGHGDPRATHDPEDYKSEVSVRRMYLS